MNSRHPQDKAQVFIPDQPLHPSLKTEFISPASMITPNLSSQPNPQVLFSGGISLPKRPNLIPFGTESHRPWIKPRNPTPSASKEQPSEIFSKAYSRIPKPHLFSAVGFIQTSPVSRVFISKASGTAPPMMLAKQTKIHLYPSNLTQPISQPDPQLLPSTPTLPDFFLVCSFILCFGTENQPSSRDLLRIFPQLQLAPNHSVRFSLTSGSHLSSASKDFFLAEFPCFRDAPHAFLINILIQDQLPDPYPQDTHRIFHPNPALGTGEERGGVAAYKRPSVNREGYSSFPTGGHSLFPHWGLIPSISHRPSSMGEQGRSQVPTKKK